MDPFMDLSTLSEEELREKLTKVQTRIYAAHAYGMSVEMRQQLEGIAQQIQDNLLMRHMAEIQQMWDNQFPDVIVSDAGYDDTPVKTKTTQREVEEDRPVRAPPKFQKVYKKSK